MSDYSTVYTCPKHRNQTNLKIMTESDGEPHRVFLSPDWALQGGLHHQSQCSNTLPIVWQALATK